MTDVQIMSYAVYIHMCVEEKLLLRISWNEHTGLCTDNVVLFWYRCPGFG